MRKMFATGAAIALASISVAKPAHALDFFFSFDNDIPAGNTPGTVSGTIFGLNDNSTGPATGITIDSFPAGLSGSQFDDGMNVAAWSSIQANSFTVSGGNIVAATFDARSTPLSDIFCLNPPGGGPGCSANFNALTFDSAGSSTANFGGFAGITFTPVPFEFEASLGLITLGAMAGGYALSKYRKKGKLNVSS